jgi:hypothetical protein
VAPAHSIPSILHRHFLHRMLVPPPPQEADNAKLDGVNAHGASKKTKTVKFLDLSKEQKDMGIFNLIG